MWSLWSLSSSYVFKPIQLMYSASSIACCNFIVFHFIQFYRCIAVQLYNCIVVIVIICSVVQLIIQFIQLFRPSTARLFLKHYSLLELVSAKKCSKRFFEKNSRFAHFGQKMSKIGHLAGCWIFARCWKSRKNLKVGVFENDFKQVPFVFG